VPSATPVPPKEGRSYMVSDWTDPQVIKSLGINAKPNQINYTLVLVDAEFK
jgi:hypothetical protein